MKFLKWILALAAVAGAGVAVTQKVKKEKEKKYKSEVMPFSTKGDADKNLTLHIKQNKPINKEE